MPLEHPPSCHPPRLALLAAAAVLATGGCRFPGGVSANLGASTAQGVTRENTETSAGVHSSTTLQLGRDFGMAAGAELEDLWFVTGERPRPSDRWRASALVGHTWLPLPHRSRLGLEAWVHGGYGRFPMGARTDYAVVVGPRLGLPIRLEASQPIWDAEELAWPTTMLVPSLGASFFVPTARGVSKAPRSELTFHLSYRIHLWSSLLP